MKHTEEFLAALLADFEANDDEHADLKRVQNGEWEQDGKYQLRTDVYHHEPTTTFVAIHSVRSGSYYSDYAYGDTQITQVWPREVTRVEYWGTPA